MNEEKQKAIKQRSKLYPRYGLDEAINLVKKLSAIGGEQVSLAAFAASIGKAVTNSSFTGRISAAKQFGLIADQRSRLSLTDLGKQVVFPRDDAGARHAIRTAFGNPPLFRELIQAFKGRTLPDPSSLSNRLFHEF